MYYVPYSEDREINFETIKSWIPYDKICLMNSKIEEKDYFQSLKIYYDETIVMENEDLKKLFNYKRH